ncbi:zinc finger protein GAI-ASSOCIATED FACTOR 1-like isoform X2 [Mercurialis annua]|uniref:zinc finger protein GAI-ASSOCIATED FACTOR 1-like isoform X2 n=1 Tax=Mercurialis annua TaxID=3986 RepID=UPI00215E010F|nr:zinc finger protein GAI-ASSOCIATED FACTOR 1-like isoform X2 [Mercurialis annua]
MSNNTGEDGSFSSVVGDGVQQQQLNHHFNLAGNPDSSAEVIALSPNTLMAKNSFTCEICNKGFQRDQNLQLHLRVHNLPLKLKQIISDEIEKRVYVCPEPSCVHHNPERAFRNLIGIKKHYSRKHGEKKWKCEKCLKKFAVQSDWNAHIITCGTKEYKCDCGVIFSRRGSFVTHRAFCDALTVEDIQPSRPPIIPNFISMPIINDTTHEHRTSLVSIFNHLDIKTPSGTMFSGDPSASLLGGATMSNCFSSSFSPLQINANSLASPAFMSVQKAAQIGASANLMSFPVAAGITLPTLSAIQTQNDHYRTTLAAEIFHKKGTSVDQFFNGSSRFFQGANSSSNNRGKDYQSGLSSFSGEATTDDFLGLGGSRKENITGKQLKQEKEISLKYNRNKKKEDED